MRSEKILTAILVVLCAAAVIVPLAMVIITGFGGTVIQ